MLKLFCNITGDDYQMLVSDTPESRKKVSGLASIVFVPVIIWFAIGFLLANQILGLSLISGLLVATVLGLLIFLIERNIILADGSNTIKRFRVILGIFIALLGAVFLDEIIFHNDIEIQLQQMGEETVLNQISSLDLEYAPFINAAANETETRFQVWQNAQNEAMREADGSGGSGRKGVDAITRIKMETAEKYRIEYEKVKAEQESLKQHIQEQKENIRQDQINMAEAGMLTRIKALFKMVFSDWAMGIIYFLLTGFLFSMEFLVVIMKNSWKKTNYERRLELIEEIGRKRMEMIKNHDASHFRPARLSQNYQTIKDNLENTKRISLFN
jgi:hypothetical protein